MKVGRIRLLAVTFSLALLAPACGGGDSGGGTSATTEPSTATTGATATTAGPATTTVGAPVTTGSDTTTATGMPREIVISAVDSEGFSLDRIDVAAGEEVTVIFQNKDGGGEPHNFHVQVDTKHYSTPLTVGPDTNSITFTINTPGEYDYLCDTHLDAMKGVIVVTGP